MKDKHLTPEEMEQLTGGYMNLITKPEDTENRNWGGGCSCEYPNKPSAHINVNLGDCSCTCV